MCATGETRAWLLLLGALALGCPSTVDGLPGGGGHAAGGATTSGSAGSGGAGGQGGGQWTDCSSPDGFQICGGPADCPLVDATCQACLNEKLAEGGGVSLCLTDAVADTGLSSCYLCPDGNICVDLTAKGNHTCIPFNVGVLFDQAGAADQVRYADLGLWTGEPIPAPDSCPSFDGFTICGGSCGGCPGQEVCTGRSPLHPYGICVQDWVPSCRLPDELCGDGLGCFVRLVEPEAQAVADRYGYCLPPAQCQQMAAELPGGGKCVLP